MGRRWIDILKGISDFPVQPARSMPPNGRHRSNRPALKRPAAQLTLVPEINRAPATQVLHCLPLPASRGQYLEFHNFDAAYVDRLRAGDDETQKHFSVYFTAVIQVKLRSRLKSREAIEDVRQETFSRFFVALREDRIRHPERLGAYVNAICNNVLYKEYRSFENITSLDDDGCSEVPDNTLDVLGVLTANEGKEKVRIVLQELPERDRRLLYELFFEERDKDDICRDFGVDREYLRVLLHRAKQSFKSMYKKLTK